MALTSLGAYLAGTRGLGFRGAGLTPAILETLECLGLMVVFLVGNLAAGAAVVLGLRALTGQFMSVYWLNDSSLAVLSLVQALIYHGWRRGTK